MFQFEDTPSHAPLSGEGSAEQIHSVIGLNAEREASDSNQKTIDLGRCGAVTLRLSSDAKQLSVELNVVPEGLDKAGVNGLIDALKKIRDRMNR